MSSIQTVRGTVDTADLGITLMHEHVFVLSSDVQQNYSAEWGSEDTRVDDAVRRLTAAYEAGVRTIVDPTVTGLGRYIPRIAQIAARIPLRLVVATGLYTYDDVPFYFRYRGPALDPLVGTQVPDPLVDMFVGDIRDGIGDTGVKAGMLKCAIDAQGLTPGVERVMRAVARAHHETGVPITVHTHPDSGSGMDVERVMCKEEGVDPGRIVLGHSGDTTDRDYLTALADAGFVLGMDRFGINLDTTFEARADTLIEMVRRGYAERMVLSQDASCYIDWMEPAMREAVLPQWHYTHLFDDVFPYVLDQGIEQRQLNMMLVEVPRAFFEGR
ncbi:phosphotriesterase family protein [Nocardia carnea]|uniref:phosphotriesterase family protein n=1 Tax=Nocardia carnea TaxID=37328 RepID=UPI00245602A1|nr:phosphotriesterase-related protein [Nocardia carnea]